MDKIFETIIKELIILFSCTYVTYSIEPISHVRRIFLHSCISLLYISPIDGENVENRQKRIVHSVLTYITHSNQYYIFAIFFFVDTYLSQK